MYITNITDKYNDTLSINTNCTNNDNNIEIINTIYCNHTMRKVTRMFNIPYGICIKYTFIQ